MPPRHYLIALALSAGNLLAQSSNGVSPLEEVNRQLPTWLRFSGEERVRFEGFDGGGFQPNNSDAYLLQRVRLNMRLLPANWLRFHFQTQDARVFFKKQKPYAAPYQDTWNLRLAYVEIGDNEKASGFRVGRQELAYGDERLVGPSSWTNTSRTFDAARATFRHDKFRLDIFASAVVVLKDGDVGEVQPGNNLHGIYGGMTNVIPDSVIEPYVFWRLSPRLKTETGGIGNLDSKTSGVRWVGKLPAGFDYGLEMDIQRGSQGTDLVHAWAGHWIVGHTWASAIAKPRFIVEYNYASGDANSKDGRRGTFDQLYPTAHDKYGLADQVGWKNIRHLRPGVELNPYPKWAVSAKYSLYWLADPHDALYSTSNTVLALRPNGTAGRFVGQELDATTSYAVSTQVRIGAGLGHLFAGEFLKNTTPGHGYTFPYLTVGYIF
jgi:hypothetical protein